MGLLYIYSGTAWAFSIRYWLRESGDHVGEAYAVEHGANQRVYKDDRPVSFIFVPSTGFKWQVINKVSAVWCKRFDGSTIEDFLEDLFRDTTERACVISDFFSGKGRAVQMWNSLRYLEASCRLCRAISEGEIGQDEGHSLFRLLFAQLQTGWILLEPGMVKATEGNPLFVQRSADGNTISHQLVSGIARIMADFPQEGTEGTPQKKLTRGVVSTTKGTYACLGGSCGHGCGTPDVGDAKCIRCTIMHMTLGDSRVGWRVREAVQHLHAVPWFIKPRVYRSPEVCTFRQVASPGARGKIVGKSDWEVVQRAFAPFNSVLYPGAGEQGCYQPFDMPMAHIECHDDEGATIASTELVVFRKSHPTETRAAFWQRIV